MSWKGVKNARKSHYHLGIVLRFSHHHILMAFDYILSSTQGPSLTVMSSMAINPSLMVLRWAVIISCGWIFTFLSYIESMKVLSLSAYSIWYLNMRSRKKAVDICILDNIANLEVILFVYFQYFLILLLIVNHWQLDGHLFKALKEDIVISWKITLRLKGKQKQRLTLPVTCPVCWQLLLHEPILLSVFPGESKLHLQMISRITATNYRPKGTQWQ